MWRDPGSGRLRRRCPQSEGLFLNPHTGLEEPRRCETLVCGFCGPRIAAQVEAAIVLAQPRQALVLSAPLDHHPDHHADFSSAFQAVRHAIQGVALDLRRGHRVRFEYVWVAELREPANYHVHLLSRGNRLRRDQVADLWEKHRQAWAGVQRVRSVDRVSSYVLKYPLGARDLDDVSAAARMRQHLDVNGQRLVHHSRDFWRDEMGHRIGGIRAARAAARRAYRAERLEAPSAYSEAFDLRHLADGIEF